MHKARYDGVRNAVRFYNAFTFAVVRTASALQKVVHANINRNVLRAKKRHMEDNTNENENTKSGHATDDLDVGVREHMDPNEVNQSLVTIYSTEDERTCVL